MNATWQRSDSDQTLKRQLKERHVWTKRQTSLSHITIKTTQALVTILNWYNRICHDIMTTVIRLDKMDWHTSTDHSWSLCWVRSCNGRIFCFRYFIVIRHFIFSCRIWSQTGVILGYQWTLYIIRNSSSKYKFAREIYFHLSKGLIVYLHVRTHPLSTSTGS